MTKVTVLGQEPQEGKKLKPIEFVKIIGGEINDNILPIDWENIELISREYEDGLDLMFAYDSDRNDCTRNNLYLGHFNDGVVE